MSDPRRSKGWFAGIADSLSTAKLVLSGRRGATAQLPADQQDETGSRDAIPKAQQDDHREPRHIESEGERGVVPRQDRKSQDATPAAPRVDHRGSRHYMSEGERDGEYHVKERTKRRNAAKEVRRPASETQSSPPVTRSRNALTLRWSGMTGGVQADPLIRTASLSQLLPKAGPLTSTATEDPVQTWSDAGKKSLPDVPVVQHEQPPPPPPTGVADGAAEEELGANSQEEAVSQTSEESEEEVVENEALAGKSPRRNGTGY